MYCVLIVLLCLLANFGDFVFAKDGELFITVHVVQDPTNHSYSSQQFTFEYNDTDLELKTQDFCLLYNILSCESLLEMAVGKQIEYLQQKEIKDGLDQCDNHDVDYKCKINTQYIANPHLHRSVHALSSEIKSHYKSNQLPSSLLASENEVIKIISRELLLLNTRNTRESFSFQHQIVPQIAVIHSCSILNENNRILDDMLSQVTTHGLMDSLDKVYVLNYGLQLNSEVLAKYSGANKVVFIHMSNDTFHFEIPTLRVMHAVSRLYLHNSHNNTNTNNDTQTNGMHILYLHTKGVSYSEDYPQITDWRDFMLYFLVERHRDCYHLLQSGLFDALGVNYKPMSRDFRGNFWWTTAHYLATLPRLSLHSSGKYEAEQWLLNSNVGGTHKVRVFNFHESGIDHHFIRYTRDQYVTADTPQTTIINHTESDENSSGSENVNKMHIMDCFAKTVSWKEEVST